MRTLVIGDIHGAFKSLKDVFDKCKLNPNIDKLIFLGDYVDGWSETSELIEYLIDIKKIFGDNVIFIKGNHDVWCQDFLNMGYSPSLWIEQGGRETLESYIRTGYLTKEEHRSFFNNLLDWYIDEENRIFIHGGWEYVYGFPEGAKLPVSAGISAKECHWNRSLLSGAKAQTSFKATREFKEVYVGHTATRGHLPENYGNLWNIDSGCGWHGKLTVMDVDTKEYWQSDFSKELYKGERGRT